MRCSAGDCAGLRVRWDDGGGSTYEAGPCTGWVGWSSWVWCLGLGWWVAGARCPVGAVVREVRRVALWGGNHGKGGGGTKCRARRHQWARARVSAHTSTGGRGTCTGTVTVASAGGRGPHRAGEADTGTGSEGPVRELTETRWTERAGGGRRDRGRVGGRSRGRDGTGTARRQLARCAARGGASAGQGKAGAVPARVREPGKDPGQASLLARRGRASTGGTGLSARQVRGLVLLYGFAPSSAYGVRGYG